MLSLIVLYVLIPVASFQEMTPVKKKKKRRSRELHLCAPSFLLSRVSQSTMHVKSYEGNDCPCVSGLPKMKVYCGRREILRNEMGKHLPLSHSADIEGGNQFCSAPSAEDVFFSLFIFA